MRRKTAPQPPALPIIASCDSCGACCMTQGSPPGYLLMLLQPEHDYRDSPWADDVDRFENLPLAAIDDLRRYADRLRGNAFADVNHGNDPPCCWLDVETRRCRYYEHRPQICRDLDVGSPGCRAHRADWIDGPAARERLRQLLAVYRAKMGTDIHDSSTPLKGR